MVVKMKRYLLLLLFTLEANAATWNLDADGFWNVNGNWTTPAIFPNGTDATAIFGNVTTSPRVVTLGQNITVGTVNMTGINFYNISGANTLTFQTSVGSASLTADNSGGHQINCPIVLANGLIASTTTGILTITSPISGPGSLTWTISTLPTVTHPLNLNAANSYAGGTTVTQGRINYNADGAIPPGSTLNLGDGTGAANTAQLQFVNTSMSQASAFFVNMASDGGLASQLSPTTPFNIFLTGIQGSGTLALTSGALQSYLFEILGTTGNTTYSGTISGGGLNVTPDSTIGHRIIKTGPNTLTLTGNSPTYLGRIFVRQGTINVQSNTALGSNLVPDFVMNGGAFEVQGDLLNINKPLRLNGTGVSGAGALMNISGNNTWSGTVAIGWSDAPSGVVASDVTLNTVSGQLSLTNVISGSSNLTKIGAGTLRYLGIAPNTMSGNTIVQEGLVLLSSSGNAIAGPLFITGGTVQNNVSNQIINTTSVEIDSGSWSMQTFDEEIASLNFFGGTLVQGAGADLTLNSNATALTMRGGTLQSGNLFLTGIGGGQVVFDTTVNGTAVIQGPINLGGATRVFQIGNGSATVDMQIENILNGGVDKQGPGTIEFFGASTYTGPTNITQGIALVTGTLGDTPVTVFSGATLGGTGTIGSVGTTVTNNGILSPGLSPGTLTIVGSYAQGPGGHFFEEVLSNTVFDRLVVNIGGVALDGTLDVPFLPGNAIAPNDVIQIIDNTLGTGVGGTFSTANFTSFPVYLNPSVRYDPNAVYIVFNFVPQALTPQQVVNVSVPLIASVQTRTFELASVLSNNRMRINPSLQQENPNNLWKFLPEDYEASSLDPDCGYEIEGPIALFIDGIGSIGNLKSNATQNSGHYHSAGVMGGGSYTFCRGSIGLETSYECIHGKFKGISDAFVIHNVDGALFATYLPMPDWDLYIDLIGGAGFEWYTFKRATDEGMGSGKPQGFDGFCYLETGYPFAGSFGTFTPLVGLDYIHLHVDSYRETGADNFRLRFDSQNINSLNTVLGATWSYAFCPGPRAFIPEVHFLWLHEFLNKSRGFGFTSIPFGDLASSSIQVVSGARNSFFAGGILRMPVNNYIRLNASYDYEWNNRLDTHFFLVGLEGRF